jgi:hypothetical protein
MSSPIPPVASYRGPRSRPLVRMELSDLATGGIMDDLDTHPTLQSLLQPSNEPQDVAMFVGYCGPSPQLQSHLRLYTSLEDLSSYVEIAHSDIVHRERAPASSSSNVHDSVWVKANACIRIVRETRVGELASRREVGRPRTRLSLNRETIARLDPDRAMMPTTGTSVGCVSIDNPSCVCKISIHIC